MSAPFNAWVRAAAERWEIVLMDGQRGYLMAVRRNSRSAKIVLHGRHYQCWIEDIALVREPSIDGSGPWQLLDHWPAVDLDAKPGTEVRSRNAPSSKSWITVKPHPKMQDVLRSHQERKSHAHS